MSDPSPVLTRTLDVGALLARKSHFLFGPRQTGKTFLVQQELRDARVYDLLDSTLFFSLSQHPGRLGEEISDNNRVVVIDEIQRLPILLHEVQRLIDKRKIRFLLTGSSARSLRRGGVNLLGGRARTLRLHPLTRRELGKHFTLARVMQSGLLPSHYFSDDPGADLSAYVGSYLQQEIIAEGATRNVPAFSRFLRIAALCNGSVTNFTNVANDSQVPRTTVYEYFEILKDTLLLHELPAWKKSSLRKPLVSSKHYFFDVGIVRILQGRMFTEGTTEFGEAFETYIMHELTAYQSYVAEEQLSFWRSASGFEVDFLIGDHTAIEVKAKRSVASQDLKGLIALAEEKKLKRLLCVCLEPRERKVGEIRVLPYGVFLDMLWGGEFS